MASISLTMLWIYTCSVAYDTPVDIARFPITPVVVVIVWKGLTSANKIILQPSPSQSDRTTRKVSNPLEDTSRQLYVTRCRSSRRVTDPNLPPRLNILTVSLSKQESTNPPRTNMLSSVSSITGLFPRIRARISANAATDSNTMLGATSQSSTTGRIFANIISRSDNPAKSTIQKSRSSTLTRRITTLFIVIAIDTEYDPTTVSPIIRRPISVSIAVSRENSPASRIPISGDATLPRRS